MNEAQNILKKYFGYENFRPGQEELIDHILSKEDVLGIMPTGAGKSVCYQVPAIILDGITIVISPLISLMKDQVDSLNEIGIPATFINSTLSYNNYEQTIENIIHNSHGCAGWAYRMDYLFLILQFAKTCRLPLRFIRFYMYFILFRVT